MCEWAHVHSLRAGQCLLKTMSTEKCQGGPWYWPSESVAEEVFFFFFFFFTLWVRLSCSRQTDLPKQSSPAQHSIPCRFLISLWQQTSSWESSDPGKWHIHVMPVTLSENKWLAVSLKRSFSSWPVWVGLSYQRKCFYSTDERNLHIPYNTEVRWH